LLTLVKDIGPILGLASFVVMSALAILYVVRARELQKLRRSLPFLVEGGNGQPDTASSRKAAARAGRKRVAPR
jgi:hypothetical protein